jgi:hypothetical protein
MSGSSALFILAASLTSGSLLAGAIIGCASPCYPAWYSAVAVAFQACCSEYGVLELPCGSAIGIRSTRIKQSEARRQPLSDASCVTHLRRQEICPSRTIVLESAGDASHGCN